MMKDDLPAQALTTLRGVGFGLGVKGGFVSDVLKDAMADERFTRQLEGWDMSWRSERQLTQEQLLRHA